MSKINFSMLVVALSLTGCAGAPKNTSTATAPSGDQAKSPAQTSAASASAPAKNGISCVKGLETRSLEVVKKDAGCALEYTKGGKASAVATSAHGAKHCEDVQKKIEDKLKSAGYKCS